MPKRFPNLDDELFLIFGTWFNSDLIDINNEQELLDLAGTCAQHLYKAKLDIAGIRDDMQGLLTEWNFHNAKSFEDASSVHWFNNHHSEQLLQRILRQLVLELNSMIEHQKSPDKER